MIGGFQAERAAVRSAITTLRHEPIMAEDFGAIPTSPQVACLKGLRSADLVILILGERYGDVQASGLSATHEEYREAKDTKPVIAFVQSGITPQPKQRAFIVEVEEWEGGLLRGSFNNPEQLGTLTTQALHDYELTTARTPVDTGALTTKAVEMLPEQSRHLYTSRGPILNVAVVSGPSQQIIRAATIDDEAFEEQLQQTAQFGPNRLFDPKAATESTVENDALVLTQESSGASITVTEGADLLVRVPLNRSDRSRGRDFDMPVLIEEDVSAALRNCLEFASQILEELDPTQRLSHVAMAAKISGADHCGWRNRAEHQANPRNIEVSMYGSREREPVTTDFPRPALRLNRNKTVEDTTVRLRRQWRNR